MADFRRSMLGLFQQGMDAVNSAVNHVTNATRSKMDELTLQNKRKELLDALAGAVYELWQKGETLPAALTDTLDQLKDVNEQLDAIARQAEKARAAKEEQGESVPQEADSAQSAESADKDEEKVPTIDVKEAESSVWPDPPVQSAMPHITVQDEDASESKE